MEMNLSTQAMLKLSSYMSGDKKSAKLPEQIWQIILHSIGISPASARHLKDSLGDLIGGMADLSSLNVVERLDVRYLREMIFHNSVPFLHPFSERHELNSTLVSDKDMEYQSEHSCVVCDCTQPTQLFNLLKERGSSLAQLDWNRYSINGPRMIMMTAHEILDMFELSKQDIRRCMTDLKVLQMEHDGIFYNIKKVHR